MPTINVTDRAGARQTLDSPAGRPLMEVLRDSGLGLQGTCGGMCSCGTCHVYVAKTWAGKLLPRSEDEQMMLEAIGELVEVRPESRLSCQILVHEELSGIELEIGPVA
ncbi:MAG TPA: 2Fe-2S iron-sulfur cluster-binding protein [Solimonas sp.]|nr:2Fe-2S iron-sulfur cluster-binding protein [Solimonas sp.]